MQTSMLRQGASTSVSNPLLGNRMTYRVAAAPAPSSTAFRQVTTMAKKKGVRIIVTLECTEARGLGETPSRYCTQKVIGCPTPQLLDQLMDWVGLLLWQQQQQHHGLGHASCAVGTPDCWVHSTYGHQPLTDRSPDIAGS